MQLEAAPKPLKAVQYTSVKPILQFFEEADPVKKQLREKEMRSLTVRSITTPASTAAGAGMNSNYLKPKAYDIFPTTRGLDVGSDSGSYQMVSDIGGNRGSRMKLMDNLSDAAGRKAMSEHVNQ